MATEHPTPYEPASPTRAAASTMRGVSDDRDDDPDGPEPTAIGRFVVIGRIGRGAMGQVLHAYDPKLHREVALKLLRTRNAIGAERMLREAQALAQLNHPNVVAIYDVGEHEPAVPSGAPVVFIAMEYVQGRTMRQWWASARPSWREAVALLCDAGHGLAAAHRVGLVHRDIKPDNILVADDGRVRVVDFGLARADQASIDEIATGRSSPPSRASDPAWDIPLTETGAVLGTPAYMAPEQHLGASADTRSDQYSFCVTLFEALFGHRPFTGPATEQMMLKTQGTIRVPTAPKVPRHVVRAMLRGLAARPDERWPTLDDLLVELARDPRRARARTLAIVGGLAVAAIGWGTYRLDRERIAAACVEEGEAIRDAWNDDARAHVRTGLLATGASSAAATADKLVPWLDAHARDWESARTDACLDGRLHRTWDADTLERASWCFDDRRMELDALVTELARTDAQGVYRAVTAVADLSRVQPCRDAALLARLPAPPREQASAVKEVRGALSRSQALALAGRYDEAVIVAREATSEAEALSWPPLVADAQVRLAAALTRTGELDEAESIAYAAYVEAAESGAWQIAADAADQLVYTVGYQLRRHVDGLRWAGLYDVAVANRGGIDELDDATHVHNLALVHEAAGEYAEAKALHERALAVREALLGPEHPAVAETLVVLAHDHAQLGENAEASALLERALAIQEEVFGAEHPQAGTTHTGMGYVHMNAGEAALAKADYDRALAIYEATVGPDHPNVAVTLHQLSTLRGMVGDFAEARALDERALAIWEAALGPVHPDVASALRNLGNFHGIAGDFPKAKALHERAVSIVETTLGPMHPDLAWNLNDLANVHGLAGEFEQARVLHLRALSISERALGPNHVRVAIGLDNLAKDFLAMKRYDEARPLLERALAIKEAQLGEDHPEAAYTLEALAAIELAVGRATEAVRIFERTLSLRETHPSTPTELASTRFGLAQALTAAKTDPARALAQARRAADELRAGQDIDEATAKEIDDWLAANAAE